MRAARARRKDANQDELVAEFRRLGVNVHIDLADWDVTCQLPGSMWAFLVEIKSGNGKLTDNEERWHDKLKIFVCRDIEDVQALVHTMIVMDKKLRQEGIC